MLLQSGWLFLAGGMHQNLRSLHLDRCHGTSTFRPPKTTVHQRRPVQILRRAGQIRHQTSALFV